MLAAGMPLEDIVGLQFPDAGPGDRATHMGNWLRAKVLQEAIKELQGADWQNLSQEERWKRALDKHYSELAYLLYSRNYLQLHGLDKTKADTARAVLESKLAGEAGKLNDLDRFWLRIKEQSEKGLAPTWGLPTPGVATEAPKES